MRSFLSRRVFVQYWSIEDITCYFLNSPQKVFIYLFLFILFIFQFHSNELGSFLIVW